MPPTLDDRSVLPPSSSTVARSPRRRPVTFGRLAQAATVLAVAVAVVNLLALSVFTDTTVTTSNTITSGTVDISASPASAVVTAAAMRPGDQSTAPLTVSNGGSLDLRYAVRSTTTENTLAAGLVLTIRSGVAVCDDANWSSTGTTLYSGILGSVAGTDIIGAPATGADAGDRTLAAGGSEVLCVNVTLPAATTVAEGVSTTAVLAFLAEQTANNP